MFFSVRSDRWHHSLIYWALCFLAFGLGINVVVTLWEGSDIGFFSANTVFTVITALVFATGLVSNLTKDLNFFLLFAILACLNIAFCIQPIVMWTDEGNLCSGLSAAEQERGRECYNAAVGAMDVNGQTTSFNNLVTLVTQCYSNNDILSETSGICYNVRWGQSTGNALRAFMFISWFLQFMGTFISIICCVIEIKTYAVLKIHYNRVDFLIQKSTLQFFRDYTCQDGKTDFHEFENLLNTITQKEHVE
tara:strand:+ start:126 stop:872 length:747 start_codon:yes stop_codon:yes gene_type:complete